MQSLRPLLVAASLVLAACSSDSGADAPAGGADAPGGSSFQITKVAWTHKTPCAMSTADQVTVTVTTTGATGNVTVSYSGGGCSSGTGNPATFTCPELHPYSASVTATDGAGHMATQAFTITVCTDGSAP